MFSTEYGIFLKKVMSNLLYANIMSQQSIHFLNRIKTLADPHVINNIFSSVEEPAKMFWLNQNIELQRDMNPAKVELMVCEIWLCRNVDAFEYYLTQILTKLFKAHKEVITSGEKPLSTEEILQCSSIDEVITRIVEKKVTSLSFGGLQDIVDYLNKNLRINFDTKSDKFYQASEIFLTRNLVVHNGTYVNDIYLQKVKKLPESYNKNLTVGQMYPLTTHYVTFGLENLEGIAADIDVLLTSKYGLLY